MTKAWDKGLKGVGLFLLLGSLLVLAGCSKLEQAKVTPVKSVSIAKPKTSPAPKISRPSNLKQEETFVRQFLEAYTTYSTLNSQKASLKKYLSPALQKRLAVNSPISPALDQVTSTGENISVWRNDGKAWLGLVEVKVNDQTSSLQVFILQLQKQGNRYVVSELTSPTQE
ncbi:hypothetical protein [Lactococcus lactis]|uniref:Lipoprotein n=1 Tax=Lactococcus lactis subsp. lactis A12 TaxID=1137134 RepID=S6EQY6_LACLL|nr:hypothetical protein [Lactococcus lactis]CDG03730.1 Putative uncharacterized protein [Lactococcus lactis subsp. lactis A12]